MLIYERMTKPMGQSLGGARLVTLPQTGFGSFVFVPCTLGINTGNSRPLGPGDGAG